MSTDTKPTTSTRVVQRTARAVPRELGVDICVVGAGIAGTAAALQAARLGRRVVIVDGLPALGGQAVNSIIATFCGLFSNGTHGYQLTYGIAEEILSDLEKEDKALFYRNGPVTTVVYYDEVVLGRWVERQIEKAGVIPLLGAVLRDVEMDGRRIVKLHFATRYGDVAVRAAGFVDATGDAALAWNAGLPCREPADAKVFGSQMVVLENIDEAHAPAKPEISERMKERAGDYGLRRREGLGFVIPGRGIAAMNMTHVETPLDPLEASFKALEGKDQADRAVAFLKAEFPQCFGNAKIRAYGFPGIRQTRWLKGVHQLTEDEVRAGIRFDDAIGRTAWPIELHDHAQGHHWHTFGEEHMHYIPLRSMVSPDADNLVAAGRCMDGDAAALSSTRVMGPCMAMGMAAAHALDIAGSGSVHQIDLGTLQARVKDNVEAKVYRWK
ncbi:MAG TPA: FAD-dependent oxidoreductase [Hyphomicrobiaceae bacterium]|nr:FAD-dependent oxidoreductase [Hyphomicrobiaceae bacterium]